MTQNLALRTYRKLWHTATLSFVLLRQVFVTNETWNLGLEMEITTHNPLRALSNTRFKFRSCECLRKPPVIFRFSWHEALLFQDLSLLFLLFVFVFSPKPVSCSESFQVGASGTTCWVACSRCLDGLGATWLKVLATHGNYNESPLILFKPCKSSLTDTRSSLML